MNESTNLTDEQKLHEGTETLQQIAEDVERERAQRGGSEFDEQPEPDERAIADASAVSEDNPDVANPTREDDSPRADDADGRAERGVVHTLGTPDGRGYT